MKRDKLTESEWKHIGREAKRLREDIMKLRRTCYKRMPEEVYNLLTESYEKIDDFRNLAEELMLKEGATEYRNIFYGDLEDNQEDQQ